jgi:transposase
VHVNKVVKKYIANKGIRVIDDYPANSPDFNVIEAVWSSLKRRIGELCPQSMTELRSAALTAWDSIPQSEINSHIAHWTRHLREEARQL